MMAGRFGASRMIPRWTPMVRTAGLFPGHAAGRAAAARVRLGARRASLSAYVIFLPGRGAATLLTHLLAESGLVQQPTTSSSNSLTRSASPRLAGEWGAADFPSYFRAVVRHSVSNRHFGFEIDPFRFEQLRELIAVVSFVSRHLCAAPHRVFLDDAARRYGRPGAGPTRPGRRKPELWHRFMRTMAARSACTRTSRWAGGGSTIPNGGARLSS